VTSKARKPLIVVPRGALALPLIFSVAFVTSGHAQAPASPATATSSTAPVTLTLADATSRALTSNPAHLARALDLALAGTDIEIAKARPNPDFLYENTRDAPTSAFIFTQPVELGGKRGHRIAVGETAREVVKADLARETADLRSDVRHAFYRLLAADRRVAVTQNLATVATRARDAARARFESGDAPQLDQVQAELAFARVSNLAATATAERAALEDELDGLIGLPPGTPLAPTGDLYVDGLDSVAPDLTATAGSVDLTAVEFDLLEHLVRHAGRKVLRDDLTRAAWGRQASPLDRSLDVHISRLRRKIAAGARIVTVRGVGYMLAVPATRESIM